ncbi:MAG: glycosyltransferase family 4 protein [Planctomycetes bacterium]|nr:glycosyltransferase family 4 protein [Planctomycetota bacterium]
MAKQDAHVEKVLLLAPQMEARGTSEYIVNLAAELIRLGVQAAVFCVPGPSVQILLREGVPIRTFDRLDGLKFRLHRKRLLEAVQDFGPQLVHAQSCRAAAALGLLSKSMDIPLVLTVHGVPRRAGAVRRVARRVDGLVVTTHSAREALVNRCKVDRQKIEVIHNGIDMDRLAEGEILPIFRSQSHVVGSVGPIERHRGHELFIKAVRLLVQKGVEGQFVVAGIGHALPQLRRTIDELDLGGRLTLVTDFTAYEQVLDALDIVVQSSLVDVSGFSILEAMGRGRPVIAFNTGTACEIIKDSHTGLVVPKGDVDELAAAIERLITDTELARRMGREARRRVKEKFSIHTIASRTLQFYGGVLTRRISG